MVFLWLDDCRLPPEGWTWVKTVEEAKALLLKGEVQYCSLDHDLGVTDQSGATGYDLLVWMRDNNVWPPVKPMVHSQNPAGKLRMIALIENDGPYQPKRNLDEV